MINSLYSHSMKLAAAGAWDRANHDLIVARVEDDVLELDAPEHDAALEIGAPNERIVVATAVSEPTGGAVVVERAESVSSASSMSEIDFSEEDMVTESESSATEDDDGDADSTVSETDPPRKVIVIKPPVASAVDTGAIAGVDNSAEADANAEVEIIENRHDESIPWEDYRAPLPEDGGDDDGGDDEVVDEFEGLDLRPVELARLRFASNLAGRLRTFGETGVVEAMTVQMLVCG